MSEVGDEEQARAFASAFLKTDIAKDDLKEFSKRGMISFIRQSYLATPVDELPDFIREGTERVSKRLFKDVSEEEYKRLWAQAKLEEQEGKKIPAPRDYGTELQLAIQDPDPYQFDVAIGLASTLLRMGDKLPDWLAMFVADVLDGDRSRPARRGKDKIK